MKKTTKKNEEVENKKSEEECGENCQCDEKSSKQCDCEGEKEELQNQVKRAVADYQNLEKRVQEQKGEWARSASKDLLVRLLPVLDTLMLASKHTEDQGIKLSVAQFLQVLKQEGVDQIETSGKDFDPHLMEGVGTAEGENGKVIEEVRPGFVLYDKVLRPAQVIVGGGLKN